jgi:ABC-type uncharacterized transport system permease subunit
VFATAQFADTPHVVRWQYDAISMLIVFGSFAEGFSDATLELAWSRSSRRLHLQGTFAFRSAT